MVQFFSNQHTYKHPWDRVTSAFWLKYPNPHYPHVMEVDCFHRHIDSDTGALVSRRLISASSHVPSWMQMLSVPDRVIVVEESRVDPQTQSLELKSRNLTGSQVLTVEETCTYSRHPDNPDWTLYKQQAKITSFAPMFQKRLEQHCLSNMSAQAQKGLNVMEGLCDQITAIDPLTYLKSIVIPTTSAAESFIQSMTNTNKPS
jgi:hypothetical protein